MNRAMIVTVGELVAYDQCKQIIQNLGVPDAVPTHFGASFTAAFITSILSNPVDVLWNCRLPHEDPCQGGPLVAL